jgi:hypothetical protein
MQSLRAALSKFFLRGASSQPSDQRWVQNRWNDTRARLGASNAEGFRKLARRQKTFILDACHHKRKDEDYVPMLLRGSLPRLLAKPFWSGPVRLLLPTALALVVLALAGCSSSHPPPPPVGNFSNASLTGQYAFSLTGIDPKGAYTARIGSFTADGAGHITGGLVDVLDLSTGQSASIISIAGGSYTIQPNGAGLALLKLDGGALQLSLSLQSSTGGFLIQSDLTATTSGSFSLQAASDFSLGALVNQYVFDLSGVTFVPSGSGAAPISVIGEFNANGTGTISGGVMDTNNGNLMPSGATAISPGTYEMDPTNGATYGRGTISFAGYTFAFYIVSSSQILVMEEDTLGGSAGTATLQSGPVPTQNSQFTGSFVYMVAAASVKGSKGPVARVARFSADGNGGLGSISLDDNNNGRYTHISQGSNITSATYTIDTSNSGSGRGTFTFTDSSAGTFKDVFYVISSSQGVVQETSASIIGGGPISAQSAGPFALSGLAGNYVFNWVGVQLGATTAIPLQEDFTGQYALANSTGTNISGTTDYVELGLSGNLLYTGVDLNGMLTINSESTTNNHYKFAVNGTTSTTINFQTYFVSPSLAYVVTSDSNRTMAGMISQQQQ